jgi:hypothetical protein
MAIGRHGEGLADIGSGMIGRKLGLERLLASTVPGGTRTVFLAY